MLLESYRIIIIKKNKKRWAWIKIQKNEKLSRLCSRKFYTKISTKIKIKELIITIKPFKFKPSRSEKV